MAGWHLIIEFRGRISTCLLSPVFSPAHLGGGCMRCPSDVPSHPWSPVLHLLITPAHVLAWKRPTIGKKQRSKNAISYFGEYPGTNPLTLLQMIEAWFRVKRNRPGPCAFPWFLSVHFYSSAAVPVILTIFTLTCRLGCILGIALVRKGLILPDNITPGP